MIQPSQINVLIACEESQAECLAFRDRGFNAYSCDIQPCRYDPQAHILGDVTPYLHGQSSFETQAGDTVNLSRWHLIIAHPPCTFLCRAGAIHLWQYGLLNLERIKKMTEAREFFMSCLHADCDYLAVENPIPLKRAQLPPSSTYINPSDYGVKYTKKTLYWLRNLPPLMAELDYPGPKQYVKSSRGKYRSRTFPQVAEALARQWGDYVLSDINKRCNNDPNFTL